jgi:hypothetical protein
MRASNGFDRLSTEEELHQVLAILDAFGARGWMASEKEAADPQTTALWTDSVLDDPADAESLAELAAKKSELKN